MFTSIENLDGSPDDIDIIIHDAGQYRLIGEKYPHERIFTELLLNKIGKNPELSLMFYVFVDKYFPRYHWYYTNYQDFLSMINIECSSYHFLFIKAYRYKLSVAKKDLEKAFEFGEIATRFCIQYLGYSLVGCGGSKVIITAQDNCDKKFAKYLQDGEYWIMRLPKVYYVPPKLRAVGYFKELPVLPTNDLYYGNDEYLPNINMAGGFAKVLK